MSSSSMDFGQFLEYTLKQFEVKSPAKVLGQFHHSLRHLMDASRSLNLLEVYLYASYYRASVLIEYFIFKARPKIISEVSKASIPQFLKDSIMPEISELRSEYFDADFIPKFSEMREEFTTFANLTDGSDPSMQSKNLQLLTEALYDIIMKVSKEVKGEIAEEIKTVFESAIKSEDSIEVFSKHFKAMVTKQFMVASRWE